MGIKRTLAKLRTRVYWVGLKSKAIEWCKRCKGRQFESTLFREICGVLDMDKTRTTPFHPQSDGLVERFNRTLVDMLSKAVREDQTDWDEQLPLVMLAYRSSIQESIGQTPCKMMSTRQRS